MGQYDGPCRSMPRLTIALLVLLSMNCHHRCQAKIKCYSNGNIHVDAALRYETGDQGLLECVADSQCVEAVASETWIKEQQYKAGCDQCPFELHYDCKTCNTELCNNKAAIEIRSNNRLCYSASGESNIGQKTIWCIAGEESCYWLNKKERYFGGCGTGHPANCNWCTVCKGNLCNYPAQFEDTRLKLSAYVTPGSPSNPKQAPTQASETKPKPKPEEKESEKANDLPATPQSTPAVKEKPKEAAAADESTKDPEDASSQADDSDAQKEKAPAKATTQKSKDDKKAAARCKPPKCRKGGNGSETAADLKKKVKKLGDDEEDSENPDEARDTGSAVRVRLITVIVTTGTALIAKIARI